MVFKTSIQLCKEKKLAMILVKNKILTAVNLNKFQPLQQELVLTRL